MADYKFPTEMVDLPSKGYFYFDGHPLSSGKVEVKYMTAKEEDILTSTNLIEQGIVIDKLLESLISHHIFQIMSYLYYYYFQSLNLLISIQLNYFFSHI